MTLLQRKNDVIVTSRPKGKPLQIPLWLLEQMCWEGWVRRRKKRVECFFCQFWMRVPREERTKDVPMPGAEATMKTKGDDSSPPGFCMQRGVKTGGWDYCKDRGLPR